MILPLSRPGNGDTAVGRPLDRAVDSMFGRWYYGLESNNHLKVPWKRSKRESGENPGQSRCCEALLNILILLSPLTQ